jgi:hypothetical protein
VQGHGTSCISERSLTQLTDEHLNRLYEITRADREDLFARRPHLAVYRERVLLATLCQGAAQHFLDGTTGIKDLDVYTFYATHPDVGFPYRRRVCADFGESALGRHLNDTDYRGRRVDLLGRTLNVDVDADPISAVRGYLRAGRTKTAQELGKKAVVVIDPGPTFGGVIWPAS